MRYADQLRSTDASDLPGEGLKGAGVTTKELDLAKRLIDDMAEQLRRDLDGPAHP